MPLPTQQWRFVGKLGFEPTIENALNAIYTLGQSTTYADGSSRTPGTGSAATWSRYQNVGVTEAVYATPATNTALAPRWIFAGVDSGSPTPTMLTPETFSAGSLLMSINKGSGAFNAWDAASPFTTGTFFGYWRCYDVSINRPTIFMYECQEALYLVIGRNSGQAGHVCLGAFIDPGSSNSRDSETDGRLYGIYTSGHTLTPANMTGATTAFQAWMTHSGTNGQEHFGIFYPNTTAALTMNRNIQQTTTLGSVNRLRSGQAPYFAEKIQVIESSAPNQTIGTLRDMAFFGNGTTGQRLVGSAGKVIGHVIGEDAATDNESILLLRNA
jgi:hypothetical protein